VLVAVSELVLELRLGKLDRREQVLLELFASAAAGAPSPRRVPTRYWPDCAARPSYLLGSNLPSVWKAAFDASALGGEVLSAQDTSGS